MPNLVLTSAIKLCLHAVWMSYCIICLVIYKNTPCLQHCRIFVYFSCKNHNFLRKLLQLCRIAVISALQLSNVTSAGSGYREERIQDSRSMQPRIRNPTFESNIFLDSCVKWNSCLCWIYQMHRVDPQTVYLQGLHREYATQTISCQIASLCPGFSPVIFRSILGNFPKLSIKGIPP